MDHTYSQSKAPVSKLESETQVAFGLQDKELSYNRIEKLGLASQMNVGAPTEITQTVDAPLKSDNLPNQDGRGTPDGTGNTDNAVNSDHRVAKIAEQFQKLDYQLQKFQTNIEEQKADPVLKSTNRSANPSAANLASQRSGYTIQTAVQINQALQEQKRLNQAL